MCRAPTEVADGSCRSVPCSIAMACSAIVVERRNFSNGEPSRYHRWSKPSGCPGSVTTTILLDPFRSNLSAAPKPRRFATPRGRHPSRALGPPAHQTTRVVGRCPTDPLPTARPDSKRWRLTAGSVVACRECAPVPTEASVEPVGWRTPQHVVAVTAEETIGADSGPQLVVTPAAEQMVPAGVASNPIGVSATPQPIMTPATGDPVTTIAAVDQVITVTTDQHIVPRVATNQIVAAETPDGVRPSEPTDHITTRRTHQHVVARSTDNRRRHTKTPCLLYTSPSPRDATLSRMPSSA